MNTRRPTMQDVAREAGVSRSLVSLVFQDSPSVSASRRAAVLAAADALGYRPNRVARNLAKGRSMTIGVVVDDLLNPFFARGVEGVERVGGAAGYQVLVANGARDADRGHQAIATLTELQVDALVLFSIRGPIDAIVEHARRVPTVFVGRLLDLDTIDSVATDEDLGCRLAVTHLAEQGHRRILHIDGGSGTGAGERRAGYRAAMHSLGLEPETIEGEFTHAAGAEAADAIAESGSWPDAIFAANDLLATGLWMQAERRGVRIPGDVSLVGYDDSSLLGAGATGLTTVRQPSAELGARAGELALARVAMRDRPATHELIAPTLVLRSSTR